MTSISSALRPEIVARIGDIFHKKDWPTSSADPTPPFGAPFERFCRLMEQLTPEEQELILQLAEDFLWCRLQDYESLFLKSCGTIHNTELGPSHEVLFVPLKNPRDRHAAKSSDLMTYLAKGNAPRVPAFAGRILRTALSLAAR